MSVPKSAQAQNSQCLPVGFINYNNCCTVYINSEINLACLQYRNSPQYCLDFPNDPICKPLQSGGGSQNTGPQNSGGNTGITNTAVSEDKALQACNAIKFKSVLDILIWIKCIIVAAIIPLIFALAFMFFLWGVFKFISANDPKTKQDAQKLVWWGIIGLFVMVSVWGIIRILGDTLGVDSTVVPALQTEYLKVERANR